jgi:hypothetical protein
MRALCLPQFQRGKDYACRSAGCAIGTDAVMYVRERTPMREPLNATNGPAATRRLMVAPGIWFLDTRRMTCSGPVRAGAEQAGVRLNKGDAAFSLERRDVTSQGSVILPMVPLTSCTRFFVRTNNPGSLPVSSRAHATLGMSENLC